MVERGRFEPIMRRILLVSLVAVLGLVVLDGCSKPPPPPPPVEAPPPPPPPPPPPAPERG